MGCPLIVSPGTELPLVRQLLALPRGSRDVHPEGKPCARTHLCPVPPVCLAVGHQRTAGPPQVMPPCWHRCLRGCECMQGRTPSLACRALFQPSVPQCHPSIALPLLQSSLVSPWVQPQYRLALSHYRVVAVPPSLTAIPVEPSVTFPTALALFQYSSDCPSHPSVYQHSTNGPTEPSVLHVRDQGAGGSNGSPMGTMRP